MMADVTAMVSVVPEEPQLTRAGKMVQTTVKTSRTRHKEKCYKLGCNDLTCIKAGFFTQFFSPSPQPVSMQ